jgi:2-oxoglutarate ferredoxin oxidoreductase subunit alpha
MVIGAGWNGARAFTATSGPGISLMTEFIGSPTSPRSRHVIIDVQRGGPSTGMPTRTQQADVLPAPTPRTATPSTCCCFPEDPTSASRCGRRRSTSPTPADAGVRDDRPRHRHEPAPVRAVRLGRQRRVRPRQGDDREDLEPARLRPLPRRRRRRHPVSHLSRHASDQGRLLHPRHHQERLRALQRGRPGLHLQHAAPAAKFETAKSWCRSRCCTRPKSQTRVRRDLLRVDQPGDGRSARRAGGQGIHLDACACAPSRSPGRRDFIAAHDQVFVVEQNRDAQLRTLLVNEGRTIDPARWCRCCTTTARRSRRASSCARSARSAPKTRRNVTPLAKDKVA